MKIEAGQVIEVKCPFYVSEYQDFDEDGPHKTKTWIPGVQWEQDHFGESEPYANGWGRVIYTVVDVHKLPRPYPTRVFYTRKWVSPDGKEFGKGRLLILTLEAFRRRARNYKPGGVEAYHDLVIEPEVLT